MATLRKAGAYSKRYARPFTRKSKVKSKNFIKAIPNQKISKFNMGNRKNYDANKFDTILRLVSKENVQIRDNALEAARQWISRNLEAQMQGLYYFEVRVYPHHVLRENKMLTGAGADRMQTGMSASFGKSVGRAAIVKQNQEIYLVATSGDKQIRIAKDVISKVKAKLPCKTQLSIEKINA